MLYSVALVIKRILAGIKAHTRIHTSSCVFVYVITRVLKWSVVGKARLQGWFPAKIPRLCFIMLTNINITLDFNVLILVARKSLLSCRLFSERKRGLEGKCREIYAEQMTTEESRGRDDKSINH